MSPDVDHWYAHFMSATMVALSFAGYLPQLAAGIGACWYLIQIYESKTVQSWAITIRAKTLWAYVRGSVRYEARKKVLVAELEAKTLVSTAQAVAGVKVAEARTEAAVMVLDAQKATPEAPKPGAPDQASPTL